jgi:hypothetical protein
MEDKPIIVLFILATRTTIDSPRTCVSPQKICKESYTLLAGATHLLNRFINAISVQAARRVSAMACWWAAQRSRCMLTRLWLAFLSRFLLLQYVSMFSVRTLRFLKDVAAM